MSIRIAIFVDKNDETATLYDEGTTKVFEKEEGEWRLIQTLPINLNTASNMKSIRDTLNKLVEDLASCKIFVAKSIIGIPYTVLDLAGYKIVEANGTPEEILEPLLLKIEEAEASKKANTEDDNELIEPTQLNKEGYYFLNLRELQENKSNITSKKALQPFLRNKTFYELQVICGHIPPWLDKELETLGKTKTVEQLDNGEFKLIISSKVCN